MGTPGVGINIDRCIIDHTHCRKLSSDILTCLLHFNASQQWMTVINVHRKMRVSENRPLTNASFQIDRFLYLYRIVAGKKSQVCSVSGEL